jgi:hypothetical protein
VSVGDLAAAVIPSLSALTGLITALATLTTSRAQLRKLTDEAERTGVPAVPGAMTTALAGELGRARKKLGRRG